MAGISHPLFIESLPGHHDLRGAVNISNRVSIGQINGPGGCILGEFYRCSVEITAGSGDRPELFESLRESIAVRMVLDSSRQMEFPSVELLERLKHRSIVLIK